MAISEILALMVSIIGMHGEHVCRNAETMAFPGV
jgi:hypothetical protein